MNLLGKVAALGAGAFVLLQFIRPAIPEKPATAELDAPAPVKHVFEKDCYSCHSDQRRLAWFDEIVPGYWLVRHDIFAARERLNFSSLNSNPAPMRNAKLYEAVNMMQLGAMPLAQFRVLHPEARVTSEDLAILKSYLDPWKNLPATTAATPVVSDTHTTNPSPQAELNGFAFDSGYKSWKALSFTDRGDNDTVRFILGNDVAIRAARTGTMMPWPDGAKIAKVAWQKTRGTDGLIRPGNFVQVELMEKNARAYKKTDGWNWGRWRGLDLKPYGEDARFVEECTGCHLPVRGDDAVYTLPITGAAVKGTEVVNNRAHLPQSLPYQPLDWFPATMYVDPSDQSMATLFVSDAAQKRSAGSVLALVTWSQRGDPHWFGARIPDQPRSVEFVKLRDEGQQDEYSRYAGTNLKSATLDNEATGQRLRFIRSLTRAILP